MSLQIKAAERGFLRRAADVSRRGKVRSLVISETVTVKLLLPCVLKEPVEVVWASGEDASWSPPSGGVQGTFSWKEAQDRARSRWRDSISAPA